MKSVRTTIAAKHGPTLSMKAWDLLRHLISPIEKAIQFGNKRCEHINRRSVVKGSTV